MRRSPRLPRGTASVHGRPAVATGARPPPDPARPAANEPPDETAGFGIDASLTATSTPFPP